MVTGKAKAVGNGIKTRRLPLSENSLKGLLNGQPQGLPEARGGGPGGVVRGWETEQSRKRKTTLYSVGSRPPACGKQEGGGLGYSQELTVPVTEGWDQSERALAGGQGPGPRVGPESWSL